MSLIRRLTLLLAAAVLGLGVAAVPAGATTGDPVARATRATWRGLDGVTFGMKLTTAHERLGGSLYPVATDGGCGDVLVTKRAILDGNVYRRPHRVGNLHLAGRGQYPLGVRGTMSPARIKRLVHRSGLRLHTRAYDAYGTGSYTYDNWVVGPRGHTLYFTYSDDRPDSVLRHGLAISAKVARGQMDMNGC